MVRPGWFGALAYPAAVCGRLRFGAETFATSVFPRRRGESVSAKGDPIGRSALDMAINPLQGVERRQSVLSRFRARAAIEPSGQSRRVWRGLTRKCALKLIR